MQIVQVVNSEREREREKKKSTVDNLTNMLPFAQWKPIIVHLKMYYYYLLQ
jgi:hypothetical protein